METILPIDYYIKTKTYWANVYITSDVKYVVVGAFSSEEEAKKCPKQTISLKYVKTISFEIEE